MGLRRPVFNLGLGSIADLWSAGQQGLWYDPSDMATLYQDSGGATSVTAVTQPTGLMLDKRLTRGPELFSSFTSTGAWTGSGAGPWSITSAAAETDLQVYFTGTIGKRYEVTITLSGVAGVILIYGLNSNPYAAINGINTARGVDDTGYLRIRAAAGASATLTGVSVKELPGNHASQATAAARPVYGTTGAQYLTFDGVDDGLSTGAITLGADMDCFIAVRRNSAARVVLASAGVSGAAYFGVAEAGQNTAQADSGAGLPTYAANGVLLNGGAVSVTRDQIHIALPVASWVVLEARNLNLSVAIWNAFSIGNYASFTLNGDIAGIVLVPAGDEATRLRIRQALGAKVGLTFAATTVPANAIYNTSGSVITDSSGSPITTS